MHESSPHDQAPAPPALNWAFLERTVRATAVTAVLVALCLSVYLQMEVGARYLFFALWSLAFFASTGLIFKNLLFHQNRLMGLGAVALKLGLLVAVYAALWAWPIQGDSARAQMMSMVAGVTTPLVVLILRALGWAMDNRNNGKNPGGDVARQDRARSSESRSRTDFQMQS